MLTWTKEGRKRIPQRLTGSEEQPNPQPHLQPPPAAELHEPRAAIHLGHMRLLQISYEPNSGFHAKN